MIKKYRKTKETEISVELEICGSGNAEIDTGIGFFDHMLESFTKHSLIDLKLICKGDLNVDFHHSVEDCGIVLGSALREAIYPIKKIERFGDSVVVMDEAAFSCALDLSNRAFLVFEGPKVGKVGEFDIELLEEFFRAVAFNAGITLHLIKLRGQNLHHLSEAAFKSFAVALRRALSKNERAEIPSTKGIL
ncbi:imidazoleglycerol-phosphate dehydratase HisB [Campylobacter hominis]|uniref:Imidazoleglycerol-phosphate dehydratase n=1 Tax=Campylobacter hominis (strain ATCC BAA-381 / DSM 21671 / CCUG 45161 / LMG 19568 / NCTC 13146 / CH001A) TaxID=360107 RepID=HIS7_CAMHC|nr:imidazoleglycerol-phosphate dehydratase HisB [Campylobacter hominis]A7I064.1 RecName: Full=Imidazoleglycerol-phosphate dehydratase; Short=IGPD [Campylobacter hominis ATCC BAA-381]ABS52215.1 imidazoleglycerol-phosphate dehydratase [Campylobacter hominis ATCC BAA-381]UAK85245.1 imidazoleglycerol-phosphate dehydratase HisB [Campylobacter hominis]SUW84459.1 imidazoleglycerol-phosphate dehydratase [Campylobacter hominis]